MILFLTEYPVGDAGYGGYNNYLFCEEHEMKKFMKFPMYQKETKDKKFHFLRSQPVKGNRYGRTEDGALLRMNRSIQAESDFNLHKFHIKSLAKHLAA